MTILDESSKTCSRCGMKKPGDQFYRRLLQCRQCKREIKAAYRINNKDKIAACKAAWRAANKAHISAYQKRYCAENAESISKKKSDHAKANRERYTARSAKYRKNNKEKISDKNRALSERIPDYLVAYRITMYSKILKSSDVPQELIEARRELIRLKRLIKEISNEKC
ncbi:hypothetical protein [Pseudomonas bohemica]|uniref:hypothetical protein n=1 Tax=Pseudomonas bohemica TaxID=2044872 RepID=UPI0018FE1E80|nr:hypothetical protein [Pseudomonas bohemica]